MDGLIRKKEMRDETNPYILIEITPKEVKELEERWAFLYKSIYSQLTLSTGIQSLMREFDNLLKEIGFKGIEQ